MTMSSRRRDRIENAIVYGLASLVFVVLAFILVAVSWRLILWIWP